MARKPKLGSPRNKKRFYANFVTSVKWLPLFLFLSRKSIKVRRAPWTKLFFTQIGNVYVWMSCFPGGCVLVQVLGVSVKTSARWDPFLQAIRESIQEGLLRLNGAVASVYYSLVHFWPFFVLSPLSLSWLQLLCSSFFFVFFLVRSFSSPSASSFGLLLLLLLLLIFLLLLLLLTAAAVDQYSLFRLSILTESRAQA